MWISSHIYSGMLNKTIMKIGGASAPLGVKGQAGGFGAQAFWLHLFRRKKVVKKGETNKGYTINPPLPNPLPSGEGDEIHITF